MQVFHDKNGNAWEIELNVGMARRVKAHLGIDLCNTVEFNANDKPSDVTLLKRLAEDTLLLFDVIYLLCKDKIETEKISEEDFAALFDGNAIEEATDALLDEIINFSRPAKRKVLQQLRKISRDVSTKAGEELEKVLASPAFKEEIIEQLKTGLQNTPESSD